MRLITITDVRRRARCLREQKSAFSNATFIESANMISKSGTANDIKRLIETMANSDASIPFRTYIRLYDTLIEKGSIGDIRKIGTFIAEEATPKVRDASQTLLLIHRRLGRTKSKAGNTSYIHKSQEELQDNLSSISQSPTGDLYSAPGSTVHISHQEDDAEEIAMEAYTEMYNKLSLYLHCDRVLENYDRISKRFNLEILFNENTRKNGVYDTVVELCGFIDTYNMPMTVKINTVIETAWYGFESNCIEYNKKDILEAATEYFAFKENGISLCKEIIETTLFFDKDEDTRGIDILMEDEPEEVDQDPSISECIMSYCVSPKDNTIKEQHTDFDKVFSDFKKKESDKDSVSDKIKNLITKLYAKNVSDIVNGTPKLFKWIRSFFIVSSASIPVVGPAIMAVSYIADRFITLDLERKEVEKMIACFNQEIKCANAKLESTKDEETKEKLEKYIDSLTEAMYKIRNYYDDLFADDDRPDSYTIGDTDHDDLYINEALMDHISCMLEKEYEFMCIRNNVLTEDTIYRLVRFGKLNNNDIINIAIASAKYPDIFYRDKVSNAIKDSIEDINNGSREFETILDKYITVDTLNLASNTLKTTQPVPSTDNLNEALFNAEFILEVNDALCSLINNMDDNKGTMLEASFANTLRMASMKLKNALTKASDKEKAMSRNLDMAVSNFTKSIEASMTNDNREAVVKGTFLPSASKIIKTCISVAAIGGVVGLAVSSAVMGIATAVISLIGYIACSAKFKAKERQMVIDEIEIELNICKKYIEIAESKNDMKALRELLSIQRNLERQLQRIKYKMKVNFGQKYYDAKAD